MTEIERMMRYFQFTHLPPKLRVISEPCAILAQTLVDLATSSTYTNVDLVELAAGLRKLVEAKDAFVRSVVSGAPAK